MSLPEFYHVRESFGRRELTYLEALSTWDGINDNFRLGVCATGKSATSANLVNISITIITIIDSYLDKYGPFSFVSISFKSIVIQALFTLHGHILRLVPQAISANFKPLGEWHRTSREALDTVTKMVVDIPDSLTEKTTVFTVDAMPPVYPYVVRAALRHIHSRSPKGDMGLLNSFKVVLRVSLDRFYER